MYENALPQEVWGKPKNIRTLKIAFDEVRSEGDYFVLIVNGTCLARVESQYLTEKTRSKLLSLTGV